jgi:hypothetical protein
MPGTPTASASFGYRGLGPKVTPDRHVPESDKVPETFYFIILDYLDLINGYFVLMFSRTGILS